jgi:hypothetical protein
MKTNWKNYYKDLNIPKDWICTSYGNDALPSFMSHKDENKGYHIWIDSFDKKERKLNSEDIYGLTDSLAPRFHVVYEYGGEENLFTSDNFIKVIEWIKNNPKQKLTLLYIQGLYGAQS